MNNNNLKRLACFVYNDEDKSYHLDKKYIIDLNNYSIDDIKKDFIKLNKGNNNFAFSLMNFKDIPKKIIFTGSCICDSA